MSASPGRDMADVQPVGGPGCPRCGYGNPPRARFCSECGLRLQLFCWSCGHGNRVDANFCQNCGVQPAERVVDRIELNTGIDEAVGSASTTDRALGDTSAELAERGITVAPAAIPLPAAGELGEERRVVTVLFADIVGFTTLSERLDAEDAREIAAATLGKLVETIALYGGTVDKLIGDAVMALFGAPVAHQDDPIRAVRAALAMQQAMTTLRYTDRAGAEQRLELRIGINTGEVVAGVRDVAGFREYSVFGDVVNTAARLQTAAEPGGTLLGETTARLTQGAFVLGDGEPLDLRGKEQPVRAFRVVGLAAESAEGGSLTIGNSGPLSAPLVGRIGETRRLRECFQELGRGRGQVVSVIGEHGIGKSRLVEDLRPFAESLGLRWAAARAPSYGQDRGYRMFRETTEELFGIAEGMADDVAAMRLGDGLRELGCEDAYPYLAFILDLPIDPAVLTRFRDSNAEQLQARVFSAVGGFMGALARQRPLMLVLDDLQWADPSSIDLLEHVMALCDEVPILFCYVFTPDRDAPCWNLKELAARAFPHRYNELVVSPLSERAARDLVCSLLDCAEAPANLEDLVLAKAEGNPYFVEEVLRSLIEQGALHRDGDRWIARGDINEIHIPDTLLATVMARIDRLPDAVRRTLQTAAVIGREFSEQVLRHVLNDAPDLDRHLREAQRAGLIREEAAIPERYYAFTQALIQEATVGSLLLRGRRTVHVRVGWALEEIYADDLEEQYAALAHHFYLGEEWERAFRYSRLAAERAAQAYANEEAVRLYSTALEAARRSAAGGDPEVLAELTERRADARGLIGDLDDALVDLEMALQHHERHAADGGPDAPAEAAHVAALTRKLAWLHSLRGDVPAMELAIERAFAQLPPDAPDLSSVWSLKSIALDWRGRPEEASVAARHAMALAEQSESFFSLDAAYQALTQPGLIGIVGAESREHAHRWVKLAREKDRPMALFRALVAHTFIHVWGSWMFDEENLAEINEALQLAMSMNSPTAEATARGVLGAGLFLRGRWDEAENELRRVSGLPTSQFNLSVINDFWLARLLTMRGALDEALEILRARLEGPFNAHVQVDHNTQLALNRRLAGDEAAATAAMETAIRQVEASGCKHCRLLLHAAAAEFFADDGDPVVAALHADRARQLGEQANRPATLLAGQRAGAVLRLRAGDADGAVGELESALTRAESIDQPYEVAKTASVLARAYRARDAAGGSERARDHLGRALEIFRQLGAEPFIAGVRATMLALEVAV